MSGAISATTLGFIGAGLDAAGAVGGALISSNAAGNAASTQANAADRAAQLQYQASQNALGVQQQQYAQGQSNLAPWLQSGAGGLANLDYLLGVNPPTTQGSIAGSPGAYTGVAGANPTQTYQATNTPAQTMNGQTFGATPSGAQNSFMGGPGGAGTAAPGQAIGGNQLGSANPNAAGASAPGTTNLGNMVNPSLGGFGSLMQAYPGGPFVAPTAAEALQSPGEQAQLQLGTQAMQQSAAAKGGLLTGGTAQALDAYGQQLASTNYQNTYNNAYNTYASGYNQFQNQQANEYNRLASLAGVGQTTASNLASLGQSSASGISSNLLSTAQGMGQQLNNAGAANASGILGQANAANQGISGGLSALNQYSQLASLNNSANSSPINYGQLNNQMASDTPALLSLGG